MNNPLTDARALLDAARQRYLAAVQRACDAGMPPAELAEDAASAHAAALQLIKLAAGVDAVATRVAA